MCGILGNFSVNPDRSLNQRLEAALNTLQHRGPDDQGLDHFDLKNGGRLSLGHKRLSIIDLSANGRQPMTSADERYTMVYNGEIYNYVELRSELSKMGHSFQTETDSEVLLIAWQQWGVECLERLDGMFAFVMYDQRKETIHCVRDAFGIKPLYYYQSKSHFCFASELPALLKILPERASLDKKHAIKYLINGVYNTDSSTFYSNLIKVLPGTYIKVSLNTDTLKIQEKKWYLPDIRERNDYNFEQASEKLRDLFLQSVKRQLRSDVPLGAALSGGIDSSAIVCAMRYLEPKLNINTFSYVAKGTNVDEEKWIDIVCKSAGLVSHKVYASLDKFHLDLNDFIITHGEPIGGMSHYAEYCVYRLAKENNITVMLEGHGADESIGGYNGYPEFRVQSLIEKRQFFRTVNFIKAWGKWPGRTSSDVKRILKYGIQKGFNVDIRLIAFLKSFRKQDDLIGELFTNGNVIPEPFEGPNEEYIKGRALAYNLRHEMCVRRCPPQLKGADRAAMRRTIENRVPFLSPQLVNFLLQMPEHYLISDQGRTKHIFRHSMRGIVPHEILNRRDKIGYETPSNLRIDLTIELKKQLDEGIERVNFLDHDTVYKIMNDGEKSSIRLDTELPWRLFNLLRWTDIFDVEV